LASGEGRDGAWRAGLVIGAALTLAAAGACSVNRDTPSGAIGPGATAGAGGATSGGGGLLCTHPQKGCACSTPGATFDCGKVIRKTGDYVTCALGSMTCGDDGAWGECLGDLISDHPAPPPPPSGGAQANNLGASAECVNNPCDPYCFAFSDSPTGLSVPSGLTVTSTGLTLSLGVFGPCNPVPASPELGSLHCFQVACGNAQGTTVSGKVFDPAGALPLPDVLVYVPNAPLSAFAAGVAADTCDTITSGAPLTAVLSDATGAFTLPNVPVGADIPLVIQSGRWRRQVAIDVMVPCANNPIADGVLSFPSTVASSGPTPPCTGNGSAACGDIPQFAVVTGNHDGMECLMRTMGIADAEFTAPGPLGTTWPDYQAGRVHVYTHNGGYVAAQTPFTALYGSPALLANYQAVVSNCTGFTWNFATYGLDAQNVVDFANRGGRLFTSHFNAWALIAQAPAVSLWPMTANWNPYGPGAEPTTWFINGVPTPPAQPLAVSIDTNFPRGADFATWLGSQGALSNGKLPVYGWYHVANSVNPPFGLQWANANTQGQYPALSGPWCLYNGVYNGCTADDSYYCGCGGWQYVVSPALGPFTPGAGPDAMVFSFDTPLGKPPVGRVMQTAMHTQQGSSGPFPSYCSAQPLNAQEKAIEFLLFQNTACAASSANASKVPPPTYNRATYTRDYEGKCPQDTCPIWRFFDYETVDPLDSSITFAAQSAELAADLSSAPVAPLGVANAAKPNSPTAPPFKNYVDDALTGAGSRSAHWLRVTMTLEPSSNHLAAPTLKAWQQSYDCFPCE
jgi:hypothetical protein